MKHDLNDVYFDVALECYDRVRKLQPGTEAAEVAEHAISLSLSEHREGKDRPLLLNDVLRNSRFSIRRARARQCAAVEASGQLARRGLATGATRAFVDSETPEDVYLANELIGCARDEACRCGAHGPCVLDGLLDGQSTIEMANAAGVSTATVNRTIRRIRGALLGAGYNQATA